MISTSEKHVRQELNSFFGRLLKNLFSFVGFILNGFYICENGVTQLEVCQRKERSTRLTDHTPRLIVLGGSTGYLTLCYAWLPSQWTFQIRPNNLGGILIKYYGSLVIQNQYTGRGTYCKSCVVFDLLSAFLRSLYSFVESPFTLSVLGGV